jgi:hypothetical protein
MARYMVSVLAAAVLAGGARGGEPVDDLLRRAFPDAAPVQAPIKASWRAQGLLVTAANFEILPDGRVRLTDCAVARFPAAGDGAARPTTARSPRADLTFDAPVRRLTDLSGRKVVSADLGAGVRLEFEAR